MSRAVRTSTTIYLWRWSERIICSRRCVVYSSASEQEQKYNISS